MYVYMYIYYILIFIIIIRSKHALFLLISDIFAFNVNDCIIEFSLL